MPEQVVQQRSRGFICINAHPLGCALNVDRQIEAIVGQRPGNAAGPKNALVIGGSTGYGLATRIALAWGFGAKTVGVFFERAPDGRKTATAGYYNTAAFDRRAARDGLFAAHVNGDAFSDEVKREALDHIRRNLGKVDLVVYSLASPRRVHPRTGETFNSVLKPIGQTYTGKTVDLGNGQVSEVTVEPATAEEVAATVAVMGGEDWKMWMDALLEQDLLAPGARTLAYSYIGPELTWPIYRHGTIGAAKDHLAQTARELDAALRKSLGGGARVSVNKAVVTQASAAIPVVPLYISLLFRVMKQKGLHEGCIEQMRRLAFDHLAEGGAGGVDESGLIRLDDLELRADVQAETLALWDRVTTENLAELSDIAGFRRDFSQLFGFDVEGVDYESPVETDMRLA
jgi:enoyl-[acyl-carrier protein] reductase/trans-2-enoyl-CoA reductase (NAD+)